LSVAIVIHPILALTREVGSGLQRMLSLVRSCAFILCLVVFVSPRELRKV
jgi:hypothetical protein